MTSHTSSQTTSHRVLVRAAVLCLVAAGAPIAAAASPPEPIALARHHAIGSTITIRGTVTVPSGAFDAGFAVQQGLAGIYVVGSGDAPRALGDELEITGALVDSSGLLAIDPSAITVITLTRPIVRGAGPAPLRLPTGVVGEITEGLLLRLEGTMVGELFDDGAFGKKLNIDDGTGAIQIFLFPTTGISTAALHAGASIQVTCFSNQFETTFECDPRIASDLEVKPKH
jgi:hypothetical protein